VNAARAIYLIRHGETPGNAARVVQTEDTPLSPRGVAQAERLAQRLADAGIARILSSDLSRAAMTAERVHSVTAIPVELEPLLQERNLGSVRGRPYAELDFDLFAPDYAPPGGETWDVFHARVDRAWERVRAAAADCPGSLAVVTHGLVCLSLVTRHLECGGVPALERGFANASLTWIEAAPPWRVRLLGCVAHLDAEAGPTAPA
jgi:broad specificity phosphatase PhoE